MDHAPASRVLIGIPHHSTPCVPECFVLHQYRGAHSRLSGALGALRQSAKIASSNPAGVFRQANIPARLREYLLIAVGSAWVRQDRGARACSTSAFREIPRNMEHAPASRVLIGIPHHSTPCVPVYSGLRQDRGARTCSSSALRVLP